MLIAMPALLANVSLNNATYAIFTFKTTRTFKGLVIKYKAYNLGAFT